MPPKKMYHWVLIAASATLLLLTFVCLVDSLRYPRIARGAYWRRPHLLMKATVARLFPGKGISKETIATHAKQLRTTDNLTIRLLYLPDLPANGSSIKERTFGNFQKTWPASSEKLFWVVTPHRNGRNITDGTLVYEYRTGCLICAEEYQRLGEFARE